MAYQFTKVSLRDLSRGLDLRSAENALQDGYSEELINIDTNSNGFLSKRPGYERHYGNLPFRVTSVAKSGTSITLSLDGSVDTTQLTKGPLVVYGRLSSTTATSGGDFEAGTDHARYYPTFTTSIPDQLPAGTSTFTMPESRHGVATSDAFITTLLSTSPVNNSNEWVIPDRTDINSTSPYDVDITTTLSAQTGAYVVVADKSTVGGQSYVRTDEIDMAHTILAASNSGGDLLFDVAPDTLKLAIDDIVRFTTDTGGSLPDNISAGTDYYVVFVSGTTFKVSTVKGGTPVAAGSNLGSLVELQTVTRTITIPVSEHSLVNFNIIPQVYSYDSVASEWVQQVIPDLDLDPLTGTVTYTVTNSNNVQTLLSKIILAAAPVANRYDIVSVSPSSSEQSFSIPNITKDYFYVALYEKVSATQSKLVLASGASKDDPGDTLTIKILNNSTSTKNYVVFYDFAEVTSNAVVVEDTGSVSETYTDSNPQLTIWGLDHSGAYNTTAKGGHVVHIDAYRREAEQRLVAGLGGTFYTARTQAEAGSTYLIPTFLTSIEGRIATDTSIAPVFAPQRSFATTDVDTAADTITITEHPYRNGDRVVFITTGTLPGGLATSTTYLITSATANTFKLTDVFGNAIDLTSQGSGTHTIRLENKRTRGESSSGAADGTVYSDTVDGSGRAVVTAVTYVSSGIADYTLSLPGKSKALDTSGLINTSGQADKLTVSGMAHSVNNGTFTILSIDDANNKIRVSNPALTLSDFDESGAQGRAAIYTEILPLQASSEYLVGDTLSSPVFTTVTPTVLSSSGTSVQVDSITESLDLPVGVNTFGSRTTDIIPVNSTDNIVAGDVCSVKDPDLKRHVRIKSINTNNDLTITSITVSGTAATVTTSSAHGFQPGTRILLLRTGVAAYDTVQTIVTVPTTTTFTFTTTDTTGASTGIVKGKTVELDEQLTVKDDTSNQTTFTVMGRWIPIEIPVPASDILPQNTLPRIYDSKSYDSQDIVRSVMVAGNMYFTNGQDQVLKFDGSYNYQAGLPRWQPQLFISVDTSTPSLTELPRIRYTARNAAESSFTLESLGSLQTGTRIVDDATSKLYTIIDVDTVDNKVFVDDPDSTLVSTRHDFAPSAVDTVTDEISITSHGFSNGDIVRFTTSGTLPAGLSTGVDYFVVFSFPDKFSVSTTPGGSKVDITDQGTGEHTVTKTLTSANSIRRVRRFKYYFRLHAIDANRNIIASAATGADDTVIDLADAGQIHMRLLGLPDFSQYDYDRLELHVFRTLANTSTFYRVKILDLGFNPEDGYIDIRDGLEDNSLVENDEVTVSLKGAELGTAWTQPPRAKYITTADNRLLLANLRDYPELDFVLRPTPTGTITASGLAGLSIGLLRDAADTATTTDMVNRVFFQFVDSGALTITGATAPTSKLIEITTSAAHGLSVGDWVYHFHSTTGLDRDMTISGWYQVTAVPSTTTYRINAANTGSVPAGTADRSVSVPATKTYVPVWLGTDGNYNQVDANVFSEFTAMLRLANAINASMRGVDRNNSAYKAFRPWIVANAGSEYGIGRIVLRQETVHTNAPGIRIPAAPTGGQWYVNGVLRSNTEIVAASTRIFPSRVVISYPNYPELFEDPTSTTSSSILTVDVNSADGQEITGIIPFFGDAVFGAGQVEGLLVIFKTNSIYLMDLNPLATGQTPVLTKIQSRGLGCTAPYSIATTKDGIIFANESGIYRLNRDQSISYVGKYVERIWQDRVNRTALASATGHHYAIGRKYKLSIPIDTTGTDNTGVLVYDHQREGQGQEFGAWTEYTNHPVTGWVNLGDDAFFASTQGRVYIIRAAGDSTDYRDDTQAIAATITLRANDFGQPGNRKIVGSITSHFQMRRSAMKGTELFTSSDLDKNFKTAGKFNLELTADRIETLRSSLPRRRLTYIQLKYTNAALDEDIVLAGIDYNVALLSEKGIRQAAE